MQVKKQDIFFNFSLMNLKKEELSFIVNRSIARTFSLQYEKNRYLLEVHDIKLKLGKVPKELCRLNVSYCFVLQN